MENSKIAVRYFTKSGNTQKLANTIAAALGSNAKPIPVTLVGYTDMLFLGASVYWGGIDPEVKEYIKKIDSSKVGKVVVFSTSALAQRAFGQMKKLLTQQGVTVAEDNFYCRGQFKALFAGRPNQGDLNNAAQFARKIVERG
ncbi:MAG: flavodoxin [Oscillospiraceae bacterium]|nr:flavodoxin [Oscillospiraceae bacterium]